MCVGGVNGLVALVLFIVLVTIVGTVTQYAVLRSIGSKTEPARSGMI